MEEQLMKDIIYYIQHRAMEAKKLIRQEEEAKATSMGEMIKYHNLKVSGDARLDELKRFHDFLMSKGGFKDW